MVEYIPPPPTLDHLNPIQRYMQKGQLERRDWIGLIVLVIGYFIARPYIQKAAKWWLSDEKMIAGEKLQQEHFERRAKVSANAIRSGKKQDDASIQSVAESNKGVATSGRNVDAAGSVVNRKIKAQLNGKDFTEEQLLEWDDEPARTDTAEGKTDVKEWLDKWDN